MTPSFRSLVAELTGALQLPVGQPSHGALPPPGDLTRIPAKWTAAELFFWQTGFVARGEVRGWNARAVERWSWLVYDMIALAQRSGWAWSESTVLGETAHWKTQVWAQLQGALQTQQVVGDEQ
jgi:hypothetical protein